MSKAAASPTTITHAACDHCGLDVPQALIEEASELQFCCGGCRVAYETIHACGLENYYNVRDRLADGGQASAGAGDCYAAFDSPAFIDKHSRAAGDRLASIDLRLEGVHCAACVWLVEHLPRVVPGVVESRLSLAGAMARVVWDPDAVKLSAIAAALDSLGYAPHPARGAAARDLRTAAERKRLVRVAIAGALAGNNMLIALALYAGVFEGIEPQFATLFRWISMTIGWMSLAWPGATFFRGAAAALRMRVPNLDLPISLALAVGSLAGTINVLLDRGEVYFDSLSVLVFLLLVGRYLRASQQRWAEEAVGLLLALAPNSCRVVREGQVVEEAVEALAVGDVVEVRPGELFPADGAVVSGESAIDRSILTGESRPVPVSGGDTADAGTLNVSATLRVRVEEVGEKTRIGRLMGLVNEGLAGKPPIVEFVDRVAGWFVLVVALLAVANLAWWSLTAGLADAIEATVALLIVACPCALGLATPLTMAVAIGQGSKRGMLIKSAAVLEKIAAVSPSALGSLLIDKTGTLTTGTLSVGSWTGDDELKPWVAAIETESNHPVAKAIVKEFGEVAKAVSNRRELPGRGVRASTPLGELLVGSPRLAAETGIVLKESFAEAISNGKTNGLTIVVVAVDGDARAVIGLSDHPGSDAARQVAWLRAAGWRPEIVSGDGPGPVARVAEQTGVPRDRAHAEVTPEEKLQSVQVAAGPVMMVGDGVNDAAALAAADVGVAVNGGAEASLSAADVYFTEPGLGKLVDLVRLAKETMRVVHRNLVISLAYNLFAVSLAVAGWISPLMAALLMPASSASVLASAVWFTPSSSEAEPNERRPRCQ